MKKIRTLGNLLAAGALGLSTMGGVSESYAQKQVYDAMQESDHKRIIMLLEENAKNTGSVVTQRANDGTFFIVHPEYGAVKVKNLSEYLSVMANRIKAGEEAMGKGVSILEHEVKRGYLSPERAKAAKTALLEAIKNYEIVRSMYGNLHYNPRSPFKREVDFFAADIREELVDEKTKEKVPYPKKMINDFADFAKKHQLDGNAKDAFLRPYDKEIGKPLTEALEELDEAINKEAQLEIKTRRYVPWYGFGERIDEFIHKDNKKDTIEGLLVFMPILGSLLSGLGFTMYYLEKREKMKKEREKKKGTEQETEIPEPEETDIINPWEINLGNPNIGDDKK